MVASLANKFINEHTASKPSLRVSHLPWISVTIIKEALLYRKWRPSEKTTTRYDVEINGLWRTQPQWIPLHHDSCFLWFREHHRRKSQNTKKFTEKMSLLEMAKWARPENGNINRHVNTGVGNYFCGVSPLGKELATTIKSWKRENCPPQGTKSLICCLMQSDKPFVVVEYIQQKQAQWIIFLYICVHTHVHMYIWNNNNKRKGDNQLDEQGRGSREGSWEGWRGRKRCNYSMKIISKVFMLLIQTNNWVNLKNKNVF